MLTAKDFDRIISSLRMLTECSQLPNNCFLPEEKTWSGVPLPDLRESDADSKSEATLQNCELHSTGKLEGIIRKAKISHFPTQRPKTATDTRINKNEEHSYGIPLNTWDKIWEIYFLKIQRINLDLVCFKQKECSRKNTLKSEKESHQWAILKRNLKGINDRFHPCIKQEKNNAKSGLEKSTD